MQTTSTRCTSPNLLTTLVKGALECRLLNLCWGTCSCFAFVGAGVCAHIPELLAFSTIVTTLTSLCAPPVAGGGILQGPSALVSSMLLHLQPQTLPRAKRSLIMRSLMHLPMIGHMYAPVLHRRSETRTNATHTCQVILCNDTMMPHCNVPCCPS